jgi:Flp pilus assembly protein TadD
MRRHTCFKSCFLLAACAFVAACAAVPPGADDMYSEDELRDTDRDLIFVTEYPVASKSDALLRADAARKAGNLDKALFFYVKALKFDPQDADLFAAIGLLHQYQGNSMLAVRAYSLALSVNPDFASVLEARGLILLAYHENDRARVDLLRAVELTVGSWRAYNGLGLLADRDSDHKLAISYYDMSVSLNPGSGSILNNRGYSKLLANDFVGAELDLRKAAETLSHDQAWVNLGMLYAQQGQYEHAVEAYEEVLPEPEAFNKVAEVSMQNGDNEKAEFLLQQAIRLSPTYFPDAEKNLAQLTSQSGGS